MGPGKRKINLDNWKRLCIRGLARYASFRGYSYLRVLDRVFYRKTGVIYKLFTGLFGRIGASEACELRQKPDGWGARRRTRDGCLPEAWRGYKKKAARVGRLLCLGEGLRLLVGRWDLRPCVIAKGYFVVV